MHIWMVALLIRSKASRHASAGGHLSIRSPRTEVAANTVKSTSSRDCRVKLVSFQNEVSVIDVAQAEIGQTY